MTHTDHLTQLWEQLWDATHAVYLPQILAHGLSQNNQRPLARLPLLPVPATGIVTLGQHEPPLTLGLEFYNSQFVGAGAVTQAESGIQTSGSDFSATLLIDTLLLAGHYRVSRRQTTAAFNPLALDAPPPDPPPGDGDLANDPDIQLARQQRLRLLGSDAGRQLVAAYQNNNDAYYQLFQGDSNLQNWWQHYTTAGKNTAFFMQHMATALQPENSGTMLINPPTFDPPGSTNDAPLSDQPSPFDLHAYTMQGIVMGACYAIEAQYNTQSDPQSALQFKAAGDAVKAFSDQTTPHTDPTSGMYRAYNGEQVFQLVEDPATASTNAMQSQGEAPYMAAIREQVARELASFDPAQLVARLANTWQPALAGRYTGQLRNLALTIRGVAQPAAAGGIMVTAISATATALELTLAPHSDPLLAQAQTLLQQTSSFAAMYQAMLLQALDSEGLRRYFSAVLHTASASVAAGPTD